MNAFDMSPRDFQFYLDERGYTGDQRADLLRRYRRANSPFAGIFDFIEGLRGGDEEAGLRRGEIAPMVFPEGMSGFEAFTTGQARPAVPGFLLGGAEAAASAVDAPSAAAAGLIPAQDAAMEALGTAGFAMGAGGAATAPAGSTRMFAGRTAKTADLSALRRAERLAERGASPEDIWSQTGWFQGVDGQWRFEIDDSGSRMRPAASQQQDYMPLGEGFSHLALQAAYPDMFSNTGIPFRYTEAQTPAGSYNRATGDLNVRGPQEPDMGTARGVALHELQHAIQHREGFAPGSNKSDAFDVLLQQRRRAQDNISRLMDQRQEELGLVGYRPETTDPELLSLRQEYDYLLNRAISDDDAYELYRRSAGEAEAEAVRARAGMSAKQRREKPPMVSINEVVPVDQQLLDINDYLAANADKSTGLLAAAAAETPTGIRAYHGSPHDFDRFSMDAIGTGEGAQAYGHGLYFAEAEPVARGYRNALSDRDAPLGAFVKPSGDTVDVLDAPDGFYSLLGEEPDNTSYDQLLKAAQDKLEWAQTRKGGLRDELTRKAQKVLDFVKENDGVRFERNPARGRMYEVNIDANPDDFLDWDKPLSEQPKRVQEAFRPRIEQLKRLGASFNNDPSGATLEQIAHPTVQLDDVDWSRGLRQQAADFMREAGIPGIKYFDAMSRGAGEGSRNFVVFDENLINIVRKYGIAGAAAVLGVSVADVEAAMAQAQPAPRTPGLLVQ